MDRINNSSYDLPEEKMTVGCKSIIPIIGMLLFIVENETNTRTKKINPTMG